MSRKYQYGSVSGKQHGLDRRDREPNPKELHAFETALPGNRDLKGGLNCGNLVS